MEGDGRGEVEQVRIEGWGPGDKGGRLGNDVGGREEQEEKKKKILTYMKVQLQMY